MNRFSYNCYRMACHALFFKKSYFTRYGAIMHIYRATCSMAMCVSSGSEYANHIYLFKHIFLLHWEVSESFLAAFKVYNTPLSSTPCWGPAHQDPSLSSNGILAPVYQSILISLSPYLPQTLPLKSVTPVC